MGHYSEHYEYEAIQAAKRDYASAKKALEYLRKAKECWPGEQFSSVRNHYEDLIANIQIKMEKAERDSK